MKLGECWPAPREPLYQVNRGEMNLYYSPAYVAFDTTRKSAWIAASLHDQPIHDVHVVAPKPLKAEDELRPT